MSELRPLIREWLKSGVRPDFPSAYSEESREKLKKVVRECSRVNYALLAVIGGSFPVFLVPNSDILLDSLTTSIDVRIFWDNKGWYLKDERGRDLFSFDLPPELFERYAEGGMLTSRRALDLKAEALSNFHAFQTINDEVQVVNFHLDQEWLNTVRNQLIQRRHQ